MRATSTKFQSKYSIAFVILLFISCINKNDEKSAGSLSSNENSTGLENFRFHQPKWLSLDYADTIILIRNHKVKIDSCDYIFLLPHDSLVSCDQYDRFSRIIKSFWKINSDSGLVTFYICRPATDTWREEKVEYKIHNRWDDSIQLIKTKEILHREHFGSDDSDRWVDPHEPIKFTRPLK